MLKIFGFIIGSVLCSNAIAVQWQSLQSLLPKGTQLSYIVVDAKQKTKVTAFQEETLRTPASILKLLTATTAKLYLGDKYHYQTTIEGNRKFIKGGKYIGDLTFYFTGDPSLTRKNIREMLQQLKRVGIKKIDGNILLNNSQFNGYQWSDGQAWNDLGVCYTSPSNAIIINRNCVLGNLSITNKQAPKATLFIPKYEPVTITSDVSVVSKEQKDEQFCALEVTRHSHNNYHLLGCMVPRKRPLALAFSVNEPGVYAQKIIQDELSNLNVTVTGMVKVDTKIRGQEYQSVFVSHQSPELTVLLKKMMKESDNLIADSLFKTIGGRYFKQPGNYRNGAKAMKAILKAQGVDLENAYIADGSGLSRHNLMSAKLFMSVMKFVYTHNKKLDLISSFSVSGVDGTLKYHKGVNTKAWKAKIIAKTGSLKGVANLVGIAKGESGDKLFVLMINGYNKVAPLVAADSAHRAKEPLHVFEKAFFNKMLK